MKAQERHPVKNIFDYKPPHILACKIFQRVHGLDCRPHIPQIIEGDVVDDIIKCSLLVHIVYDFYINSVIFVHLLPPKLLIFSFIYNNIFIILYLFL